VPGGSLIEVDEARWRQAWDLKVFGYINQSREIYRAMAERGRGVIVNILGTAGNLSSCGQLLVGARCHSSLS
jgi:NADP-dependent 3-hydroxy acid dehydrogenase YdfG